MVKARSFGQRPDPEQEEFTVEGAPVVRVTVHADVTPDHASLNGLREVIRGITRQAILDGYADAFAIIEANDDDSDDEDDGLAPAEGNE